MIFTSELFAFFHIFRHGFKTTIHKSRCDPNITEEYSSSRTDLPMESVIPRRSRNPLNRGNRMKGFLVMDGMITKGKLLSQDDVDAILTQSGLEGDYDSKDSSVPAHDEKRFLKNRRRTQEEADSLSCQLYNKAFLEREEGVSVIWNAAGAMPIDCGQSVKIQGKEYLILGVLQERHLIVGSTH